jgi:hypothetical protein
MSFKNEYNQKHIEGAGKVNSLNLDNLKITNTFKYLKNFQDGYVLTSDENGNAIWEPSLESIDFQNTIYVSPYFTGIRESNIIPYKKPTIESAVILANTLSPNSFTNPVNIYLDGGIHSVNSNIILNDGINIIGQTQSGSVISLDTDLGVNSILFDIQGIFSVGKNGGAWHVVIFPI